MRDKAKEQRTVPGIDSLDWTKDNLAGFFALSIDMLCIAGMDGYFKVLNPAWERILGFSSEELCSKPYLEFVHPDDRESTMAEAEKVSSGAQALVFENRYLCRDGSYRWLSWNSHPVPEKGLIYAVVRDITEQKQMEESLRASEDELRTVFNHVYEALIIHETDGTIIQVNDRMLRMYGVNREQALNMSIRDDLSGPDNPFDRLTDYWERVKAGETRFFEWQARRPGDGSVFDVEVFLCKLVLNGKERILAAVRDVTERKRMQRKLQTANEKLKAANEELDATNEELAAMHEEQVSMNEELIATEEELRQQVDELNQSREALNRANQELLDIIDFLPDATFVINRDGKVVAWNKALEKMTGVKKEEIVGRGDGAYAEVFWGKRRAVLVDAIISGWPSSLEKLYDSLKRKGDTLYAEVFVPGLYGGRGAYVWAKASPLFDHNGNITGAIESVRDITDRKQAEGELKYLSTHDSLTGLYNRHYFEQEVQRLQNNGCASIGIILCDVDGLKLVNDSLGHEAGDKLLVAAARLVKNSFRKTDLIARVGGDEFAVLLPGYDEQAVESGGERIREAVRRYNAKNPSLPLSISVGCAVSAEHPVNLAELYREADNNMYREKLHQSRSNRSATVQTLMKALEARDFITEGHADRLQMLVARVGEELGLPQRTVADLRLLAQFHDIGKVGIPDRILFKAGPLTPAEMRKMKRHSEIGHRIALSAPDLHPIADWILHHHEWWNGQGYPLGLKGEEIPLECRILAIADAYDAMTSDRPYRKALSHEEAVAELRRCAGIQFDPDLTHQFISILETLEEL